MKYTKLTDKQKAVICQVAAKAWQVAGMACGYNDQNAFRRGHVLDIHGKSGSIKDCHQGHYVPLYNHFAKMAGIASISDNTPTCEKDKVAAKITKQLQKYGFGFGYVVKIAMDKFGVWGFNPETVRAICDKLTENQAWQLYYTIQKRGRSRAAGEAAAHGLSARELGESEPLASDMPPERLAEHFGVEHAPWSAHAARKQNEDLDTDDLPY